ncbi:hypothetical protein M2140_001475 [Clostridiales Family XIII bacterium PM5-7]
MFELFSIIGYIIEIGAPIIAAVYAYKAYQLVKQERELRIAKETAKKEEDGPIS